MHAPRDLYMDQIIGHNAPGKPTSRGGISTGFHDQQSTVKPRRMITLFSGTGFVGSPREHNFVPQDSRIAPSAVANLERGLQGAHHVQISAPEIENSLNGANGRRTTQSPGT